MSGFTPGPWAVRDTPWAEGKKYYIDGPRGRALATTLSLESSDPTKKAEVAANASLIAAAPQLYDAAVDTLEALNLLRSGLADDPKAVEMIDAHVAELETALLKARQL